MLMRCVQMAHIVQAALNSMYWMVMVHTAWRCHFYSLGLDRHQCCSGVVVQQPTKFTAEGTHWQVQQWDACLNAQGTTCIFNGPEQSSNRFHLNKPHTICSSIYSLSHIYIFTYNNVTFLHTIKGLEVDAGQTFFSDSQIWEQLQI